MRVFLGGVGIIAPGLENWQVAAPVLRGDGAYREAPLPKLVAAELPPAERRRATAVTKLALDVAMQAGGDRVAEAATVFASSGGEVGVIDQIFRELATPAPQISPTLFHNSVHNAASGYWSIATGSRHAAMSLSVYDDTFAAGFLEAAVQATVDRSPVLLICYDFPPLPPIARHRPLAGPFGVSLLLQPERGPVPLASLEVDWGTVEEASVMEDAVLDGLRLGNPAGRSLPLLATLAQGRCASVRFALSGGRGLTVGVTP